MGGEWKAFTDGTDIYEDPLNGGPVITGMEVYSTVCANARTNAVGSSIMPHTPFELAVFCSLFISLFVCVMCAFARCSRCRRRNKKHEKEYAAVDIEVVNSEADPILQ